MADDRFQQIEALFQEALDLPPASREKFLRERAGSDEALFREAASLLAAYDEQESLNQRANQQEAASAISRRVGPYLIERLIGKGGMGAVYQARRADGQFEQTVAVKFIALPLATDFFRERFLRERQILATLEHANITRLLDGGLTAENDPYLVMEYVDGLPLDTYCDRRLLDIPARLRLFRQVCSAVSYAHRNLVIHRDLKPGNILVSADGVPKLLDFGTAKLLTEGAGDSTTKVGMLTPRFASPEELRGEPATTLSDVYSLGTILYELLSGGWPYGDPKGALAGLERAVREVPPTRPSLVLTEDAAKARSTARARLARTLDGDLGNIVLKAIAPEPQRRYRSVEQLSEDLDRWMDGRPVSARPQTIAYRARTFVRRHWIAVPAAALAIVALAASAIYSSREAHQARLEAAKSKAVTRFFQGMLASSSPIAGGKEDVTVREAMDLTRKNIWRLSSQPSVEAAIHYSIGNVYLGLNKFQPAKEEIDRSLEMARRLNSPEDVAAAEVSLANIQLNVAKDFGPAEENFRQAVRYIRKTGTTEHPELAHACLTNLAGGLWTIHGHSPEVRALFQEGIAIARSTSSLRDYDLADDLNAFGGYLIEEGKDEEAAKLLNEALTIQHAMPYRTLSIGMTLMSLAQIRAKHGDLAGAERFFREDRDEMLRQVGWMHNSAIDAVSRWGRVWAALGHADEAALEVGKAMDAAVKVFPPGASQLWVVSVSYAYVLNLANRGKDAEVYARRALECVKGVDARDPRRAESLLEIGVSLVQQKRSREAIPILEESEEIYRNLPGWGPQHRQTIRAGEFLAKARAAAGG